MIIPKKTIKTLSVLLFLTILCSCNKDRLNPEISQGNNEDKPLALCQNGFADIYPCNGYDLMGHMPLSKLASSITTNLAGVSGSDIWGWTDPATNKEYAVVCTSNSTAFVDITNPFKPTVIGILPTTTIDNSWRDVKVYNNHAFVVADGTNNHGMQVFDLTRLRDINNPPQTVSSDTVYDGVTSCHNIFINETEGVAYLVGCNIFDGGPVFIDISNPTNPVQLGGYANDGYSHDAQVVTYNGPDTDYIGQQIYIGSNGNFGGANKVVIIDVTDKNNPQFIADVEYPNPRYAHQGWFTEDLRYFIFGDELDEQDIGGETRTFIFNLEDLDNPTLSSTYFGTTLAIDHNGYVKGNEFYLANYRAGLRVLDISNIASPTNSMTETGFFDTFPGSNSANFNGTWSVYPFFQSGNIIISDIERGLFIVKKSDI